MSIIQIIVALGCISIYWIELEEIRLRLYMGPTGATSWCMETTTL